MKTIILFDQGDSMEFWGNIEICKDDLADIFMIIQYDFSGCMVNKTFFA